MALRCVAPDAEPDDGQRRVRGEADADRFAKPDAERPQQLTNKYQSLNIYTIVAVNRSLA